MKKRVRKVYRTIDKGRRKLFKIDKILLFIIGIWMLFGLFIFVSASLGLMIKSDKILSNVLSKQFASAFVSFVAMLLLARVKFPLILKASPYVYVSTLLLNLMVFVPGIGFASGGAKRWIYFGALTLQPSEFLKFSTILITVYLTIIFKKRQRISQWYVFFPLLAALPSAALFLAEPDTSTTAIMLTGVAAVFFLSGAKWRHILVIIIIALMSFALLVQFRPYIKDRIMTYLNPRNDVLGSSYQINQSLIAIGSGGLWGKGFGQGVQKFGYLPEPVGDSIFATLAEETGFIGVSILLFIISAFVLRSFKLASKSKNAAASLIISALAIAIFVQAMINISAMSGIIPLTGLALPFVSLGGSSMLSGALALGVIFSAAKRS